MVFNVNTILYFLNFLRKKFKKYYRALYNWVRVESGK